MFPTEIIKKKRNQKELSLEEIQYFIDGYTSSSIPDYQMSALLMAILLNGMEKGEVVDLTQVMLDSGDRVHFGQNIFPVDKHSTGGVGDKTSLILAPIVAACGVPVPMMSGRGLGHTGGTLDKLESIPGFQTQIELEPFKKQVEELNLCFIGQTKNICPADKKIYALRDVTATVESLPLICASIMSKKIAEGIRGLVLDVKVGSGAFMKTIEDAEALAEGLISIGQGHNIQTTALITNMNQPLGRYVGNALEVHECISILKRENFKENSYKDFKDTEDLSVELAAQMISTGKKIDINDARKEALNALDNGTAFEVFEKVVIAQGGDLNQLPPSENYKVFNAPEEGYIKEINTEKVGLASISLGAGRKQLTDVIDNVAGLYVHKKQGEKVLKGEPLYTLYYNKHESQINEAEQLLTQSLVLESSPLTDATPLIIKSL